MQLKRNSCHIEAPQVTSILQERQLYYNHLQGKCICLQCECGRCKCPFLIKRLQAHQRGKSLYQQEYTPKEASQGLNFNPSTFQYSELPKPLDAFRIKHQFKSILPLASLKPEPRIPPKLEEFSRLSQYSHAYKQQHIEHQEPIKPINSIQIIKDVPYFYKSNYNQSFKQHVPPAFVMAGPSKAKKGLIGSDFSFQYNSKYKDDFKNYDQSFQNSNSSQFKVPYIQQSAFQGQYDTSSRRSFKPHRQHACPAKAEVSQNQLEYSAEKYSIHL